MRLLIIHQNLPGQFRHILQHYAKHHPGQVVGLGEMARVRDNIRGKITGAILAGYEMPASTSSASHAWLGSIESATQRGLAVYRALVDLKNRGFTPDVVLAHPGWGEVLFVKDVFPACRLIAFCEFFYRAEGQDIGFDPLFPATEEENLKLQIRNMVQLQALSRMDYGISPTQWQKHSYPEIFHSKMDVIHDGIDTNLVKPDEQANLTLPNGQTLSSADEVVTFVNRNLEPCRGFVSFMRALPVILRNRPNAQIIIVGGDDISYGKALAGKTWRQAMLDEVGAQLDLKRIHFVGKIPYSNFIKMLQISTAHVYFTYPFVLSWSMLEAMSAGCVVIGSRTAPVEEVIQDQMNGYLVDFFDIPSLAEKVSVVCENRLAQSDIRTAARQTIIDRFDLQSQCLPRQLALIENGFN